MREPLPWGDTVLDVDSSARPLQQHARRLRRLQEGRASAIKGVPKRCVPLLRQSRLPSADRFLPILSVSSTPYGAPCSGMGVLGLLVGLPLPVASTVQVPPIPRPSAQLARGGTMEVGLLDCPMRIAGNLSVKGHYHVHGGTIGRLHHPPVTAILSHDISR